MDDRERLRVFRVLNAPGSAMRQIADWMTRGPLNPPPAVKAAIDASQRITAETLENMTEEQRMRLAQDG